MRKFATKQPQLAEIDQNFAFSLQKRHQLESKKYTIASCDGCQKYFLCLNGHLVFENILKDTSQSLTGSFFFQYGAGLGLVCWVFLGISGIKGITRYFGFSKMSAITEYQVIPYFGFPATR